MCHEESSLRGEEGAIKVMKLWVLAASAALVTATLVACGDDGTDSSTATTGATTTTTTGSGMGDPDGYTAKAQPILKKYCSPFHEGMSGCSGAHCSATVYADTQKDSTVCAGEKIFTCLSNRIKCRHGFGNVVL